MGGGKRVLDRKAPTLVLRQATSYGRIVDDAVLYVSRIYVPFKIECESGIGAEYSIARNKIHNDGAMEAEYVVNTRISLGENQIDTGRSIGKANDSLYQRTFIQGVKRS